MAKGADVVHAMTADRRRRWPIVRRGAMLCTHFIGYVGWCRHSIVCNTRRAFAVHSIE